MRSAKFLALAFLLVTFAFVGLLFGQTQTGTITGKVTDETGAVLPGVAVTLTSEALIQARTMVTTDTGSYQFVNCPPGFYSLQYELPGFTTLVRQEIRISVGFVAQVNVTLEVAGVAETLTVTGESPTVDVKTILKTTRFDSSMMENLPSSRDPWIMSTMVPGAQPSRFSIGGTESMQQYGVAVHGSGSGASINIDGLLINWTGGSAMLYYDFSMFEEMSFQTNAQPAEVDSPGMSWNMVTASGGNAFGGEAIFLFMNRSMAAENLDDELIAKGATTPNPVDISWDLNGKFGGPIIRDKVWFFTAARYWRMDQVMQGAKVAEGQDEWIDDNSIRNFFGKVTWQINPNNSFTYNFNRNWKYRYHRMASDARTWLSEPDATYFQDQIASTTQGKFTSVISEAAFLDARAGIMFGVFPLSWQPNVDSETTIGKRDTGLRTLYDAPASRFRNPNWRLSINTSYSHFLDDFMGGTHNLKAGLQFGRCSSEYQYRTNQYGMRQNYRYGEPYNVTLYNYPTDTAAMWNSTGLYVQDDFTLKNRLTLNLGLRFDRYVGWVPAHTSPAGPWFPEREAQRKDNVPLWNNIAPRLGFALDLTGDGKTAIKGNFSRYYGRLSHGIILNVDPTGTGTDTRTWTDLNGDDIAQIEEMGPSTGWRIGAKRELGPNLRNNHEDEITLGVEREVATDFNIGVTYYHRKVRDDYTSQNLLVSQDDYTPVTIENELTGEPLTVYEISEEKRADYQAVYRNNPLDWSNYNGVEFTYTKRYSHGWQLMGGFTVQKNWGGRGGDPGNPNNLINAEGIVGDDSTYVFKILGSYRLPYDIMFSGNYRFNTGYPLSLELEVSGLNQGGFDVPPVPRGEYRMQNVSLLDLRASKTFTFMENMNLELMLDLYNLFNSNIATRQNVSVGPNLFDPIMIMTPRTIRVGFRYAF